MSHISDYMARIQQICQKRFCCQEYLFRVVGERRAMIVYAIKCANPSIPFCRNAQPSCNATKQKAAPRQKAIFDGVLLC